MHFTMVEKEKAQCDMPRENIYRVYVADRHLIWENICDWKTFHRSYRSAFYF